MYVHSYQLGKDHVLQFQHLIRGAARVGIVGAGADTTSLSEIT